MISIESTGKTVKQAIEEGLKKLDRSLDEVEVKIITQPGIFKKAKVLISVEGVVSPALSKPSSETAKPAAPALATTAAPKKPEEPKKDSKKEHKFDKREEKKPFIKEEKKPFVKENRASTLPQNDKPREERADRIKEDRADRADRPREERVREHKEKEYKPITDEAAKKASDIVEKMVKTIDPEAVIINRIDGGALCIKISSNNGAVIGYKGETLDAIEYLTSQSINKGDNFFKISVDCNEYRIKRQEMLVSKAKHLADKAIKTGRKIVMEPMSNYARKIIHAALQDNNQVFTKSEGNDPHRHVVIVPKRKGR